MLPGESFHDFEAIRQMMVDDIQPETNIEWLWTLDLVELSWEILRYRHLKKRILDVHRVAAIEAILQRLDGEGMPAEAMPLVRKQARRAATEWRDDSEAALEIEARLSDRDQCRGICSGARVIRNVRSTHALGTKPANWIAAGDQHPARICYSRPPRHKGGRVVILKPSGEAVSKSKRLSAGMVTWDASFGVQRTEKRANAESSPRFVWIETVKAWPRGSQRHDHAAIFGWQVDRQGI